jgi:CHAT domain-containing protein/tetratricopeptide (TPR) repeat protein
VALHNEAAALQQARAGLAILKQVQPEPLEELIGMHRLVGGILLKLQDGKALASFEESLELARKITDERRRSPAVADALVGLGHAFQVLHQLDRALQCFGEARKLREEFYKKPHDKTAAVIRQIAGVQHDRGDRDACTGAYRESLRMLLDLHGDRSWEVMEGYEQLATAHLNFDEPEPARSNYREAQRIAQLLGGPGHPAVADCLSGLAAVAESKGDYDEALKLVEQEKALRAHLETSPPESMAHCWNQTGLIHHKLHQDAQAAAAFRRALTLWEKGNPPNEFKVATGWHNLGHALAGLGRMDRAFEAHNRALALREQAKPRDELEIAASLNALGALYYQQEDYARAREYHVRAWEILRKQQRVSMELRVGTLNNIGMSHYGLRQWADAIRCFDLALEDLRIRPRAPKAAPDSPQVLFGFAPEDLLPARITVQVLQQRGAALWHNLRPQARAKEWSPVTYSYLAAVSVLEQLRGYVLESEESRWGVGTDFSDLASLLVGGYYHVGRLPETKPAQRELLDELAFRAAEFGSSRTFLRNLARARAELVAGLPPALRQRREQLRDELKRVDQALNAEQARPPLERDFEAVDRLMRQRRGLMGGMADWEKQAERDQPHFLEIQAPTSCSLAEARSILGADEVALLYVSGAAQSYVLVVEGGHKPAPLTIGVLPKAHEIAEWVAAVVDPASLGAGGARDREHEGYQMLLAPVADRIKGKQLVIVPTGELSFLPFELLAESINPNTDQAHYLIENHRIRYAPSLTVMAIQRKWEKAPTRPDRVLFAVGDPIYDRADARVSGRGSLLAAGQNRPGEYALRERVAGFPRLPFSGAEVNEIAKLLGVSNKDIHVGTDASKRTVKAADAAGELARYRYLHFATHGILGLDTGKQPSLVLSLVGDGQEDGFLQLDEVTNLKLNADLVVLSACRSGQGHLYNGEGVKGLARAFLHAGSRGVVCSLWQVDDQETARFMVGFYTNLKKGQAAAEGLRNVQLDFIHQGKAPLYWAPFILIGE